MTRAKKGDKTRRRPKKMRKKKPFHVCIYGRTLNTFCPINGLINRGVDPKRIYLVTPPRKHDLKTAAELTSNHMR